MTREGYQRFRGWRPSARQRQVLDLLVEAKSNAEIALALDITPDGVKWHVNELLSETGLKDRQGLAHWWVAERERPQQPAILLLRWSTAPRGAALATVV